MIPVRPWLTRDFTFDHPKWTYPQAVERVRGGPARFEETVAGIPSIVLTLRRGDAWSIQEEVGHVADLETLMAGRLQQLIAGIDVLHAWPGSNDATWNAQHNQKSMEVILRDLRRSRLSFVQSLDSLPEDLIERSAFHPRLKKQMRTIDLAYFVAEHDDHHLARITAAKRSQGIVDEVCGDVALGRPIYRL